MTFSMHTAAERPDLWERGIPSASVWPEYNLHDEVVAEGHTGPLWWDGQDDALPQGIDAAIEQIFTRVRAGEPVNTLCALAAESPREGRARGLAEQLLDPWMRIHERLGARVSTPLPSPTSGCCTRTSRRSATSAGRRRTGRGEPAPDDR